MIVEHLRSDAAVAAVAAPPIALAADALAPTTAGGDARLVVLVLVSSLVGVGASVLKELGLYLVALVRARRRTIERDNELPPTEDESPRAFRPDGPDVPEEKNRV